MKKIQAGYLFEVYKDEDIYSMMLRCKDLCHEFNQCIPSDNERKMQLLTQIIGSIEGEVIIEDPFCCDFFMD